MELKVKDVGTTTNQPNQRRKWDRTAEVRKTRVYVDLIGENILENLINRHHRPTKVFGDLARPIVKQMFNKLGLRFVNMRWSQKAGCQCGCSPAFVVNGAHTDFDVWIKVEPVQLILAA